MIEIQRYIVDAFSKHDWSLEQDNFGGDLVKYDDHAAIVAQLETELAEAKKDQARYQWLRNEAWAMYNYGKGLPHVVVFDSLQRPTHLAEEGLDENIDAAIASIQDGK